MYSIKNKKEAEGSVFIDLVLKSFEAWDSITTPVVETLPKVVFAELLYFQILQFSDLYHSFTFHLYIGMTVKRSIELT